MLRLIVAFVMLMVLPGASTASTWSALSTCQQDPVTLNEALHRDGYKALEIIQFTPTHSFIVYTDGQPLEYNSSFVVVYYQLPEVGCIVDQGFAWVPGNYFTIEVQVDDTVWDLLQFVWLAPSLAGLPPRTKLYIIKVYELALRQLSPNQLRDLGFTSGDVDLVYPGDVINLTPLFTLYPTPDWTLVELALNRTEELLDVESGLLDAPTIACGHSIVARIALRDAGFTLLRKGELRHGTWGQEISWIEVFQNEATGVVHIAEISATGEFCLVTAPFQLITNTEVYSY